MKQIPLITWAQQHYDPLPSIHTLRRWCREGRIFPHPVLVGRDYRVREDATYTPASRPISLAPVTVLQSKDQIVNAIISGPTTQPRT